MISLDPQINGSRDDGSEGGLIRSELARGRYVQIPLRRGWYDLVATGASVSASLNGGSTHNMDGTQTGLFITVPTDAAFGRVAELTFWVTGNVFGLRYLPTTNPIGCMIDGVAYAIPQAGNVNPISDVAVSSGMEPWVESVVVATDLGPGRHFVSLTFPCATSGSNRTWTIYGYVADSQAGHEAVPRGVRPVGPFLVGTAAAPGAVILSGSEPFFGARKILFYNTTGSPVTVYLEYTGGQAYWSKSVPANDVVEFDPGGILYTIEGHGFRASATGVYATLMGSI